MEHSESGDLVLIADEVFDFDTSSPPSQKLEKPNVTEVKEQESTDGNDIASHSMNLDHSKSPTNSLLSHELDTDDSDDEIFVGPVTSRERAVSAVTPTSVKKQLANIPELIVSEPLDLDNLNGKQMNEIKSEALAMVDRLTPPTKRTLAQRPMAPPISSSVNDKTNEQMASISGNSSISTPSNRRCMSLSTKSVSLSKPHFTPSAQKKGSGIPRPSSLKKSSIPIGMSMMRKRQSLIPIKAIHEGFEPKRMAAEQTVTHKIRAPIFRTEIPKGPLRKINDK